MEWWKKSKLAGRVAAFFRRDWRRAIRLREKLKFREEAFHLVLAAGVGVIGGLVNLFWFHAIEQLKLLVLRNPGDPVEIAEIIGPAECVLVPTLGALAAGLVMHWGLRLVGRQGSTNILEAVVAGDGRLPLRSGLIKGMSSLVSIGTGASVGREGGITELSATLASKWGQLAKWPPYRLRLLVGCGAAAGIAAAYNAPISGAVFAAIIVLGNFSMNLFAPLVCSSVVATMVSRSFFGIKPWYTVPPYEFTSLWQLPWFLLLGVLSGVLGAVFLKLLRLSDQRFRALPAPIYLKMMLGGAIVGVIAIKYPEVWGNGYVETNRILQGNFGGVQSVLLFLTGLLLAKIVATVATIGSGAVGGVFTPTLFLGAALGGWFGTVLQQLNLIGGLPISSFALVGMGATLAATTRAPFLAFIMVFEISLDYSLMPPLMLGCVVSIIVSSWLHRDSVYTEPLRRRGLEVERDNIQSGAAAMDKNVGDLMHAPVTPIRETARLREMAERFLTSSNNFLPVVDAEHRLIGVVALHDLKEFLNSGEELSSVIAYDVMRPAPPAVTPGQRLIEALPVVLQSDLRNVPVVNSFSENRLVGALGRLEVLSIFSEAIAEGSKVSE